MSDPVDFSTGFWSREVEMRLEDIKQAIMADEQNQAYTQVGIEPLFAAPRTARILIIGQAPGLKTQQAGLYWKDKSGDRLRIWLGVSEETFYQSGLFAVLPMDFYYPGKGRSGDLPPRKGFADKWHPLLLENLPDIELTLLIGSYAQQAYLELPKTSKLTETVASYQDFLPAYFPLVHPSPRNRIWLARHSWFEERVVPDLQRRVAEILKKGEEHVFRD